MYLQAPSSADNSITAATAHTAAPAVGDATGTTAAAAAPDKPAASDHWLHARLQRLDIGMVVLTVAVVMLVILVCRGG
jgi:hypothetical protein